MRTLLFLIVALPLALTAQVPIGETPNGEGAFDSNCAVCHGMNATGGRGPNLHGRLLNGDRDSDIADVIRHGVPGTTMPAFRFDKDELAALVKYIQTLRQGSPQPPPPAGDKVAGRKIYERLGCANCHAIDKKGSTYGPSLTRVGAGRSYEYLKASIVDPSTDVMDEYRGVTTVTRDGKRHQGIIVNEDTFTIQIRLPNQSFLSYDKEMLQEVIHEKQSLMPAYKLNDVDLKNLLSYLSSLTGPSATSETKEQPRLR